jgi:molybdopterin-containing oxidoreductase family membrane subunit
MFVNVGMWFERFVIIITSLTRDFLPSSWGLYKPTWVDIGMFAGSFGLFGTLFLLFCRFIPMVAMAEVKNVMPQATPRLVASTTAGRLPRRNPPRARPRRLKKGGAAP